MEKFPEFFFVFVKFSPHSRVESSINLQIVVLVLSLIEFQSLTDEMKVRWWGGWMRIYKRNPANSSFSVNSSYYFNQMSEVVSPSDGFSKKKKISLQNQRIESFPSSFLIREKSIK